MFTTFKEMEAYVLGQNMKKRIALANKETLVCAGELVMDAAEKYGAEIVPVDSEHSAIFQSLQGCRDRSEIKRLLLTCSGGPFFGKSFAELEHMTAGDALRHPNWTMGAKITIDSATLMNKGLEVIEAMRLYRLPVEKVDVVIHRQSQARNGEIVVALFEDEATVKTLSQKNGQTWLLPANSDYQPIDGTHAQIIGKVVALLRRY